MPHLHDPDATDLDEGIKILADLKDRVSRLESNRLGGSQNVQQFRQTVDFTTCTDATTVTVGSSGNFIWGTSEWGFDEFAQTN